MAWQANLSWQDAKKRAEVIQKIRDFFRDRDVIEVETPQVSNHSVTDIYLDTFSTNYDQSSLVSDGESKPLFLQTSPEYAMKRLLASGYQDIYQLCKAYRNEPSGRYHNPEFSMLEWYRVGFSYVQLMEEVEALLVEVLACPQAEKVTYQTLFISHVGFDPLNCDIEDTKTLIKQYDKWADWMGKTCDKDDLMQIIFTEIIEPKIGLNKPCFVYDFPASQASLAKLSTIDPRVAQRFECYYHGIELVNGFQELTCVQEQKLRFEMDNDKRLLLGKPIIEIDRYFIEALASGLPECAGVALGVDRLLMIALGKKEIRKTLTFAIDHA